MCTCCTKKLKEKFNHNFNSNQASNEKTEKRLLFVLSKNDKKTCNQFDIFMSGCFKNAKIRPTQHFSGKLFCFDKLHHLNDLKQFKVNFAVCFSSPFNFWPHSPSKLMKQAKSNKESSELHLLAAKIKAASLAGLFEKIKLMTSF